MPQARPQETAKHELEAMNTQLKDKNAWIERERKNLKSIQELLGVSQKRQIEPQREKALS